MNKSLDMLSEAATKLGKEHGKQRASIAVDKLTIDLSRKIIAGYESSDSEVMDLCPEPLSGEWADDPVPMNIIDQIANLAEAYNALVTDDIDESLDRADNILDLYEKAFKQGFWDSLILSATTIIQGVS